MTGQSTLPQVVIVGAGFGGLSAARALKNTPVRVTVIDRSNHHLFQPLLYQVATAALSPADIAAPIRGVLSDQRNCEVVLGEVIGVDPRTREVRLKDRSLSYDYLVLATGAGHSYFGRDEWSEHAPGLKSLSDAREIREKILMAFETAEMEPDPDKRQDHLNFIIVGGGPTGVEMAGSIAELAHVALAKDFRHINPRSARVILIEAGKRVLSSFPEDLSASALRSLERLGVEVRTGARVEDINAEGVQVSGTFIRSRCVIWAAGVVASPAAKWLGAETDRAGRAKVTRDLRLPGLPDVFVIGDTAWVLDEKGQQLPGIAPVAMQQGRYAAGAIQELVSGKTELFPFDYVDKGSLATIGRRSAVGQIKRLHLKGFIAWFIWMAVHVFYLIGFRNRVLVMIQWAWAYITFQRGARLITHEFEPLSKPESDRTRHEPIVSRL